jgi:nitrate reductase cytochrome c-type subunit
MAEVDRELVRAIGYAREHCLGSSYITRRYRRCTSCQDLVDSKPTGAFDIPVIHFMSTQAV